jgi:hypothetical protein
LLAVLATMELHLGSSTAGLSANGNQAVPFYGYMANVLASNLFVFITADCLLV